MGMHFNGLTTVKIHYLLKCLNMVLKIFFELALAFFDKKKHTKKCNIRSSQVNLFTRSPTFNLHAFFLDGVTSMFTHTHLI